MGKEGNGCDAELLSMKEREGKGRVGARLLGGVAVFSLCETWLGDWGESEGVRVCSNQFKVFIFDRVIKIHSNIMHCSRRRK
jgi:hypothetical protein